MHKRCASSWRLWTLRLVIGRLAYKQNRGSPSVGRFLEGTEKRWSYEVRCFSSNSCNMGWDVIHWIADRDCMKTLKRPNLRPYELPKRGTEWARFCSVALQNPR